MVLVMWKLCMVVCKGRRQRPCVDAGHTDNWKNCRRNIIWVLERVLFWSETGIMDGLMLIITVLCCLSRVSSCTFKTCFCLTLRCVEGLVSVVKWLSMQMVYNSCSAVYMSCHLKQLCCSRRIMCNCGFVSHWMSLGTRFRFVITVL